MGCAAESVTNAILNKHTVVPQFKTTLFWYDSSNSNGPDWQVLHLQASVAVGNKARAATLGPLSKNLHIYLRFQRGLVT